MMVFTGAVFLDLKKAFDTVHHKTLLSSLFGVTDQELDWFTSYLSGRLQVCKIKDNLSETLTRGGHLYLKLDIIRVKKFT